MACLLGLIDVEITTKHHINWQTSKIGGLPNWFERQCITAPDCGLCKGKTSLAVQLYCPLDRSPYHRTLYIFACTKSECWNKTESWTVYRCQQLDPLSQKQTKQATVHIQDDDWGTDADDWGTDADDWGTGADDCGTGADDWGTMEENLTGNGTNAGAAGNNWGIDANNWSEYDDNNIEEAETVPVGVSDVRQSGNSGTNTESLTQQVVQGEDGIKTSIDSENICVEDNMDEETEAIQQEDGKSILSDRVNDEREKVVECCDINQKDSKRTEVTDADLPLNKMCIDDVNNDDCADFSGEKLSHVVTDNVPTLTDEQRIQALHALQCESHSEDKAIDREYLCPYFINVFEEPANQNGDNKHVTKLLKDYQRREGYNLTEMLDETRAGSGGPSEKYEKTSVLHQDKVFHKFMKRLAACPEQIIRYQWNGEPLFISPLSSEIPVSCQHCGAVLVFELQLTPALVNQLKFPGQKGSAVEFGTVLVFTCSQSCWKDTDQHRKEQVLVQADPDQHLFK